MNSEGKVWSYSVRQHVWEVHWCQNSLFLQLSSFIFGKVCLYNGMQKIQGTDDRKICFVDVKNVCFRGGQLKQQRFVELSQLIYIAMDNNMFGEENLFEEPQGSISVELIHDHEEDVQLALLQHESDDEGGIIALPDSHTNPYTHFKDHLEEEMVDLRWVEHSHRPEQRSKPRTKISQNHASMIKTLVGKVFGKAKSRTKSNKSQTVKEEFIQYLKYHKACNDQMITVFLYLFLVKKEVDAQIYQRFRVDILEYLGVKEKEKKGFEWEEEQESEAQAAEKIKVWQVLVGWLFRQEAVRKPVDMEWLLKVCGPLFRGRQHSTIHKRIRELETIQDQVVKAGFCQDQPSQNINNLFGTKC